jgi:hypothetical protein
MGAVHIDKLVKVLDAQHVKWSRVGTKSIRVTLNPVGSMRRDLFVQAVHDSYTRYWPMPWIFAADRKPWAAHQFASAVTGILTSDLEIMRELYIPGGMALPMPLKAGLARDFDPAYDTAFPPNGTATLRLHDTRGDVDVVLQRSDKGVGKTAIVGFKYPFRLASLKLANTGVYVDDDSKDTLVDVMVSPSEPVGDSLADILKARKVAGGKWSGK